MARGLEIRFLGFGEGRVAYAVSGDGPPLVAPAWWVSHLELDWREQRFRSFWESVGEGHALVLYDGPGVGMSDRELRPEELTLESEVALLSAARERFARLQRAAASAETAAALLEMIYGSDVRSVLARVRVPTVVVHRRGDRAEQLVLSEHTVHRHVANIRHKLGRGSRTAAVAEAARLGLL